jgi:adenylosuccinate synthase
MNNRKKPVAIIDIGFGDAGKGLVTSTIAKDYSPINSIGVRFSGGVQAAHRVCIEDKEFEHIFSTAAYVIDSYWAKYCPVNPKNLLNEYHRLNLPDVKCYIDGKAPVTTELDISMNIYDSTSHIHGTCGFGVGKTIEREENHISLLFEDLFIESVTKIKLKSIYDYYKRKFPIHITEQSFIDMELGLIKSLTSIDNIILAYKIPDKYTNIIFEGSQGLLLDQTNGFFPNVARTNTGTANILDLGYKPDVYLVTRAYQNRHGNGPMTNIDIDFDVTLHDGEANVSNKYQGDFRTTVLDLDLMKYAIMKDEYLRSEYTKKSLVITCIDHLDIYKVTLNGELYNFETDLRSFVQFISKNLGINDIYINRTEQSGNLTKL